MKCPAFPGKYSGSHREIFSVFFPAPGRDFFPIGTAVDLSR